MRGGGRSYLAIASLVVIASQLGIMTAFGVLPPPGSYHIRVWMLPSVDALSNKACLTQGWHSTDPRFDVNRALDWKAGNVADTNCTFSGPEVVSFRALASSIDEAYDGTYWPAMYGVRSNLPLDSCPGGGTVHLGKVKIYAIDGLVRGFMIYAHTVLDAGQFNINAKRGATISNAYLVSVGIGDTVQDGPSNCWTGWHVHEINSDDAVMYWDSWNSKWSTATLCNCYTANSSANWIRRMTTVVSIGE